MRAIFSIILVLVMAYSWGQSTDIPLNGQAYQYLDEWDVKSENGLFTTIKPISRRYFAEQTQHITWGKGSVDALNYQYVLLETREYQDTVLRNSIPIFGRLFQYASDVVSVENEGLDLHVNPVVVLAAGKESASDDLLFENYRGLELRGTIDKKVSFYSLLTENQARYPEYVRQVTDSTLGVPYEGFWKQYNKTGVDFLRAQAYIDFNVSKHIGAQFGYGKQFIGDGKRSLILSDFGNNYPYLRLNTRIWKIQYTNIYAQLIAQTQGGSFGLLGTGSFPKKYFVNHHLSIQVTPKLTLGLFESVVYGDSSEQLKVSYLNPMIFYRALEQQDGSSDNVILGLDFKWNLWKQVSLYGQLVIDELIVSEAFGDDDWWGNKQGFQLGAKYFDVFGIQNLNAQVELNRVRPYVYSHEDNLKSFTHYNMALAHPLGANFQEVLMSLNYRILPRLEIQGEVLLAQYGNDSDSLSYGRDVMKSYNLRPADYGNELLQGDQVDLTRVRGRVAYQLIHNLFLSFEAIHRLEKMESGEEQSSTIFNGGLRWNFPDRPYSF